MAKPPSLEFVMELRAELDPPLDLGMTPAGHRRSVSLCGGRFEGPRLRGEVLAGGADWQVLRSDGAMVLEARYALRTDDGALIGVRNSGLRHAPPAVTEKLMAGEPVAPGSYYFRTTPQFETSDARYAWMNQHIFIGDAEREPDAVVLRVWQVL